MSVTKTYHVDFDGNLLAEIRVENGNLKVIRAVNGYGQKLSIGKIKVKNLT